MNRRNFFKAIVAGMVGVNVKEQQKEEPTEWVELDITNMMDNKRHYLKVWIKDGNKITTIQNR